MKKVNYEVATGIELAEKYNLSLQNNNPLFLRKEDVPFGLQSLIPYAEFWGISDDMLRYEFVQSVPNELLVELQEAISQFEDELDEWLAGPESLRSSFSDAYVAFTCMRMAADEG